MTLYLTDNTSPAEIEAAAASGFVRGCVYPAGATTNSDAGVTDVNKCMPALEKMAELGLVLEVHGEVTHGAWTCSIASASSSTRCSPSSWTRCLG